jgi:hypothetical protein
VEVIGKVVMLLRIEPKVLQMMPGLSSVSTKVLGGEVKVGTKVKVEFVKLWLGDVLPRYLFWVSSLIKEDVKPKSTLISSLLIKSPEEKTPPQVKETFQERETLIRLTDCLRYITDNMYKTDSIPLTSEMKSALEKLLAGVSRKVARDQLEGGLYW